MSDSTQLRPSFGIKTSPMHTTYEGIVSVWRAADATPEIEHAWLWDHMLPLAGDPAGPIYEGWTLLAALAAQTERVRLGLMVTAAPVRPPAVLAKMAATVDVISGGRLDLGIGVGATARRGPDGLPFHDAGVREYEAYGLPLVPPAEGVARLAESLAIISALLAGERVTASGRHYAVADADIFPRPVQRPRPPILIGGWGPRTLRVVAEHADIWNTPGPPHVELGDIRERARLLDEQCTSVGRDPAEITRSVQVIASPDDPAATRGALGELIEAGFTHLVLGLVPPHTADSVHWAVDEVVGPVRAEL